MKKELVEEILKKSKDLGISEKEVCSQVGAPYKSLYYYKKKYGITTQSRGKNINSKKKRVYNINDNYFSDFTLNNCY